VIGAAGVGFMHRVTRDADTNRCIVDQKQDPKRTGRAYTGVMFDNGFVSFKTTRAPSKSLTLLRLSGSSTAPKLIFDASAVSGGVVRGVLPVAVTFSEIDQQLYVVDITARGLIPVPLANMPPGVSVSIQ
jgi:hypothetical protein